ncbi:MAG: 2OG-Fe(II) oxygenase [Drouetiella hepatica Uher 2000/2452]|uniref:2OG-Fe(II) oxygenase n=1 Tax=Drouetiella hepatica Uher 2000/2452 TaxID=904376 RepID=A0A951UP07_9CYAN|nr:2OG-Fe(II) oxygenase [Drouetiella hepatica Uher 2000/2452]
MSYYHQQPNVFSVSQLSKLRDKILHCPYFVTNNLNRDFIGTKGFSVVFRRSHISEVERQFPFFKRYLDVALQPDCNAFYLNPLQLREGSQVYPHIDRSLRSYCKTIEPPDVVSVLYIQVPEGMRGGDLVLRDHRRQVGQIQPQANSLLQFQGNLTHSVTPVETVGFRLSLVCEQYNLVETELEEIPEFTVESRATKVKLKL